MDHAFTTVPPTMPNPNPEPAASADEGTAYDPQRTAEFQLQPLAEAGRGDLPSVPGFLLEQELGRGGMGVVYRARQVPLNRVVALKMILAGDHASTDARVRFLAEAEAIAKVRHPGIVQVYEFGTHQGHPYFALECVEGGSLDRLLARSALPPRNAAALLVQLAEAVHAAHVQGIIHRDLKPANVLLSLNPVSQAGASAGEVRADGARLQEVIPKITDFGLAKQIDAGPGLTATGAVMGTPSYMAPEQAEGRHTQIGPRTDVYALGAILYECLTGRPPFKGATGYDTLAMVLRQEPVPVRQLQPNVPKDVETICHKCLHKEPGKRYASAQALADDLRNHLDGKPILARPVGRMERLWKWCRRYPAVAALMVVSTLAAMVSTVLAVWAISAEQEAVAHAHRADQERDAKELQRQQAEAARAAEAALRRRAEQAEADLFEDYRASSDEVIENLIGSRPELGPNEKAYLERTVQRWQAYAARMGDSPRGRWLQANGHLHMGMLRQRLGRTADAARDYAAALELLTRLAAEFPDMVIYRRDLANCHGNRAMLLATQGQHADAEAAYRAALALQQPLVDSSDYAEYRMNLATMHTNLGNLLTDLSRFPEAEAAARAALQLRQRLAAELPDQPFFRWSVAESHINLSYALDRQNRPMEVEAALKAALPFLERLVADHADTPKYRRTLAICHGNLGNLYARQGRALEADACYRTALRIQERLVNEYPALPHYRQELGGIWLNQGELLQQQGQAKDAVAAFRNAQRHFERLAADQPGIPAHRQALSGILNNLGLLLADQGQAAEAEKAYRASLALRQKLAAEAPGLPGHRQALALSHMNLGILDLQKNRLTEAETHWKAARQFQEQLHQEFPANPVHAVQLGGTYCNLGNLATRRGDLDAALDWYARALTLLEPQTMGAQRALARQYLCNTRQSRAIVLEKQGRYADADADWDAVLQLCLPVNKAGILRIRDHWKGQRKK